MLYQKPDQAAHVRDQQLEAGLQEVHISRPAELVGLLMPTYWDLYLMAMEQAVARPMLPLPLVKWA